MFLDQMDLVEQALFLEENPEVRILVCPMDDYFRTDIGEPFADYVIDYKEWEAEFSFQVNRHQNRKVNVVCIAILKGNGEYLGYERITKKARGEA